MKKLKIVYLTGTRADFGLMTPVLKAINSDPYFNLKILVTGMHLMPKFGSSIKEVKKIFPNLAILPAVFESDKQKSVANFCAKLLPLITKKLIYLKPDLVLILGDRPEMLVFAMAAFYLQIPIAHIHGGDKTQTLDDCARHAITKLSSLHFVATKEAQKKIINFGEKKERVYLVGAPALDVIKNINLLSKSELSEILNINLKKYILLTIHPISEKVELASTQMETILKAITKFNLQTIIIYPNADPGGRAIIRVIKKYENKQQIYFFKNLSHKTFLSLVKHAQVWLGNSSAGIIESASFKIPVINIGSRQDGRVRAKNIIDVDYDKKQIINAMKKALNLTYRKSLTNLKNPWGNGNTSKLIVNILKNIKIDRRLLTK